MVHILIVAPDSELRRSVEFALATEGYDVTSRASIAAHERPTYDCTVVDQHALGNDRSTAIDFCSIFAPVILLSSHLSHPLAPWTFRTLMKPLLGPSLIAAVNDALLARPVTT